MLWTWLPFHWNDFNKTVAIRFGFGMETLVIHVWPLPLVFIATGLPEIDNTWIHRVCRFLINDQTFLFKCLTRSGRAFTKRKPSIHDIFHSTIFYSIAVSTELIQWHQQNIVVLMILISSTFYWMKFETIVRSRFLFLFCYLFGNNWNCTRASMNMLKCIWEIKNG